MGGPQDGPPIRGRQRLPRDPQACWIKLPQMRGLFHDIFLSRAETFARPRRLDGGCCLASPKLTSGKALWPGGALTRDHATARSVAGVRFIYRSRVVGRTFEEMATISCGVSIVSTAGGCRSGSSAPPGSHGTRNEVAPVGGRNYPRPVAVDGGTDDERGGRSVSGQLT